MTNLKLLLGTARLPFLVLTPACIVLGWACASATTAPFPWVDALLVLFGALLAHVSVNAFNEYLDFRSGLDLATERTPFSGGSGTLPAHPELAPAARALAVATLGMCMAVGAYFVWLRGSALLPLGLAGVVLVVAYTRWVTRSAWLCLVAPGLGFGPLMVLGTDVALTGHYHLSTWAASLTPFFLVNNLLLLNQFPDVEADRQAGRRHLLVQHGTGLASRLFVAMTIAAYAIPVLAVGWGWLPWGALLGLGGLILAVPAARDVLRHHNDVPALLPAMGRNVGANLLTPVLMATGMTLQRLL
ncbi:prenyltransferase [Curvibacter sp. APW13]|uniref:prenyltransferase n=1 Tax=Curvibacter sp. APW13 TaxID=3077236 RepID=UPI0028DFE466|nr:prenyltransferase [Curvibacter sp. APW13]MDT8991139.1 prenyltransferase [Curvibacter sp. APW13]